MNYLSYVNTKMGTESTPRFSRGNTLPLTALPFSMVSFCPQTEILSERPQWFFDPRKPYLDGIRLTHQASPWIGDYGTVLITPQSDFIANSYKNAGSSYDTNKAELTPSYLKAYFNRARCGFELTPTERGCAIRLGFDTEHKKCISILGVHGNTTFKLRKNMLYVTNDYHQQGDIKDFKCYIVIKVLNGLDKNASKEVENGFHLALNEQKVELRVGISYISHEMALETIGLECGKKSFDTIKKNGTKIWNSYLGRLTPEIRSKEQKGIFYSCLYRAFLFPRKAYEIKRNGARLYYAPYQGMVKEGVRYTDHGAWDTYRTTFPLFSLVAREEYEEILRGMISDYKDCGYLPRWSSFGEVGCMPSTLVDAIIAQAVASDIGDKELHSDLLEAMLHHANCESKDKRYGRNGIEAYLKFGYVPADFEKESVNLTLDFAYGDWCIAQVAKTLGKNEIASEYLKRGQSYKALFDKETGYFRPKDSQGNFVKDFDPSMWGGGYTESGAYQCLFGAPHALDEIANMLGGREEALKRLDEFLSTEPTKFRVKNYGGEIHEMSEMALSDLGQCAISNQPSFSMPFLPAYLGNKKKTIDLVEKICKDYFTIDSYPGDEDTGSMSSWYIFATLGKFPICPGKRDFFKFK